MRDEAFNAGENILGTEGGRPGMSGFEESREVLLQERIGIALTYR